ncbi:MAG: alpha/beta hydrolase [Jatrophihabitans sp.]|uniref:alpha/beta hydrolase n=1 Tax=Jatrophihabitans sp. TaxID=1932789 RepID=UPI003F81160A
MQIAEQDRPFAADGSGEVGGVGVLLSHGFTGTPATVRPWAEHLAAAGLTVRAPLLPGHGRTWRETNRSTWTQWYGCVEDAYLELAERCSTVVVGGLSMGGALVTRLAEQHPGIAGVVLVNPAFGLRRLDAKLAPFVCRVVRSRPGFGEDIQKPGVAQDDPSERTPVIAFASMTRLWKQTVRDLHRVTAPVLLFRSRVDHVLDPLSAELLVRGARNTSVREVVLEHSWHVATLDHDAPLIHEGSLDFVRSLLPAGRPA